MNNTAVQWFTPKLLSPQCGMLFAVLVSLVVHNIDASSVSLPTPPPPPPVPFEPNVRCTTHRLSLVNLCIGTVCILHLLILSGPPFYEHSSGLLRSRLTWSVPQLLVRWRSVLKPKQINLFVAPIYSRQGLSLLNTAVIQVKKALLELTDHLSILFGATAVTVNACDL